MHACINEYHNSSKLTTCVLKYQRRSIDEPEIAELLSSDCFNRAPVDTSRPGRFGTSLAHIESALCALPNVLLLRRIAFSLTRAAHVAFKPVALEYMYKLTHNVVGAMSVLGKKVTGDITKWSRSQFCENFDCPGFFLNDFLINFVKLHAYDVHCLIYSFPITFFLSASLSLLLPPLGLLSPSFLLAWPQTRSAALLSPAGVLAAATAVAVLIAKISFSLSQLMRSAGGGRGGPFVRRADGAVSYARASMMVSCTGQAERPLQRSRLQTRRARL